MLTFNWDKFFKYTYDINSSYYLFTVGFTATHSISEIKYKDKYITDYINIIDPADSAKSSENSARNAFLIFVRDFPTYRLFRGQNIFDILQYRDINLWWYLQITEKSIWISKMIHRLFAFYRFKDLFSMYDDIDFVNLYLSDKVLSNIFQNYLISKNICFNYDKNWLYNFKYNYLLILYKILRNALYYSLYNIILKLIIIFYKIEHNNSVVNNTIAFFSVYPLWWKNINAKYPTDVFFGDIPHDLENNHTVNHLVLLDGLRNITDKKCLNVLNSKKYLIINKVLNLYDILSIFNPLLIYKLFLVRKIVSKKSIISIDGQNFSELVKDEIVESLVDPTFFRNILLDRALRHIEFSNYSVLLYRLEFQTLERPLLTNSRNKTKTIGLQHSAMSDNFLNYVFTKNEFKAQPLGNYKYSLPLPDVILACGNLAYKYFIEAGYSKEQLFVVGGVRFKQLHKLVNRKHSKNKLRKQCKISIGTKILFIPMSQILSENISLIKDLIIAVKSLNIPYHIVIKINPIKENNKLFIAQIKKLFDINNKLITMEMFDNKYNYLDYLCASDAVLLTGGSVAFECVILGVPPIIYICHSQFSHNPMTKYPSSVFLVDNSDSLSKALVDVDKSMIIDEKINNFDEPINDIFGGKNLSPKTELINKVSEFIN